MKQGEKIPPSTIQLVLQVPRTVGNHGILIVIFQLFLNGLEVLSLQKPQKGKDEHSEDWRLNKLINDCLDGSGGSPRFHCRWNSPIQKLVIKVIPWRLQNQSKERKPSGSCKINVLAQLFLVLNIQYGLSR